MAAHESSIGQMPYCATSITHWPSWLLWFMDTYFIAERHCETEGLGTVNLLGCGLSANNNGY